MFFPFFKYHGTGNDFIIIDNRKKFFPLENSELIRQLCFRKKGIGADGLILLEDCEVADFRMKIFNSDGKEALSCGNGLCCLAKFLIDIGFSKRTYKIALASSTAMVTCKEDKPVVTFSLPKKAESVSLTINNEVIKLQFIDMGVPHAVCFVDDVKAVDVQTLGKQIREHAAFAPKGVNVDFASPTLDGFEVRTYERGVEAETLACGTGACAVALCAPEQKKEPMRLYFPGGITQVHIDKEIHYEGAATCIFSGKTDLKELLY